MVGSACYLPAFPLHPSFFFPLLTTPPSSLSHPSFSLLSFISLSLSFSLVVLANCYIALALNSACPSTAGCNTAWGMGNWTSIGRQSWLASQTCHSYIHNTTCLLPRPPLQLPAPQQGPSWRLGRTNTNSRGEGRKREGGTENPIKRLKRGGV